jgi:hypothetical protein
MLLNTILSKQKSFYQMSNGKLSKTPIYEYYRVVNQYAKELILDYLEIDQLQPGHALTLETEDYKSQFVLDDLTLNQSTEIADKLGIGVEDIFSNPDHMIIEDNQGFEHVFSLECFETRDSIVIKSFGKIIADILNLENNQVSHIFVPQDIATNLAGCVFEVTCHKRHGTTCRIIAANNSQVNRLHEFYGTQQV